MVATVPTAPVDAAQNDPAPDGQGWFAVDVVDPEGRPSDRGGVVPDDCPGFQYHRDRQMFSADIGRCTVRAMRRDGALFARSEPVVLSVTGDDPAYAQLELAMVRTGGIGVRFQPDIGGMRVISVVEGAPAWDAGLEPGDLIVSVDGEPVDGLDSVGFVERMTGPEGTAVGFEVRLPDGATEEVEVKRSFLEG